ncbi:MAG TPA: hypothetical protein VF574_09025 [Allosphingosinicella sp.]|jgi:hypothetical protein
MTARTSEKILNAFLRAFAATGNQGLAAEEAGVSRSTILNRRRADPAFGARWRSAKAQSEERLGTQAGNRPPPGWRSRGGADLAATRGGKVIRSPASSRWTPRAEDRFLGFLRRCANSRLACAWAGMTLSSYEAHWRRWPDFRRRVAEAKAFGRLWVEARSGAGREGPFEFEVPPELEAETTIAERIRLARRHRRRG